MTTSWIDQPDHRAWLLRQTALQLQFARNFPHPGGGSWWLDEQGRPDQAKPVHTYVTARMLHAYSLGHLAGIPGCAPLAARALQGLTGQLRDAVNAGWFASIGPGPECDDAKEAYAHAFVVLAASSATFADIPGARALLDEALHVLDARFWEEAYGLHRDQAAADWSEYSNYRGINANMHSVEALLAASDATGDPRWRERAARITTTVLGWARGNGWRVPEHFDAEWSPMMEHHRDEPDHPFQPYGATVGHGLEWARLALHVAAAGVGDAPVLTDGAVQLFQRAVADGWAVDGADGFVYTTDWTGTPVVRQRMHWVVAEAICAAAALLKHTGDRGYDTWYRTWWDYAATYLIDDDGSWRHELDPGNQPAATVWSGRPDLYHSLHATLLPRLPLAPTAPAALAGNR
ncbi:AGE family epimerase/isomerase [Dermatophilaceae bacterium Sec6.4]